MKLTITVEIDGGANVCRPKGTPCRWLRTSKFGTLPFCAIFSDADDRGRTQPLEELGGWLMRHDNCMKAEEEG